MLDFVVDAIVGLIELLLVLDARGESSRRDYLCRGWVACMGIGAFGIGIGIFNSDDRWGGIAATQIGCGAALMVLGVAIFLQWSRSA